MYTWDALCLYIAREEDAIAICVKGEPYAIDQLKKCVADIPSKHLKLCASYLLRTKCSPLVDRTAGKLMAQRAVQWGDSNLYLDVLEKYVTVDRLGPETVRQALRKFGFEQLRER